MSSRSVEKAAAHNMLATKCQSLLGTHVRPAYDAILLQDKNRKAGAEALVTPATEPDMATLGVNNTRDGHQ